MFYCRKLDNIGKQKNKRTTNHPILHNNISIYILLEYYIFMHTFIYIYIAV